LEYRLSNQIDALKTVEYYQRALNRDVLDFYRGDMDASEFLDDMIRLIEGPSLSAPGMKVAGTWALTPRTTRRKMTPYWQERIDQETDFVLDYAEAIEKAKEAGDPVGRCKRA